jgi:AAA family ATP:ADP antiporter
LGASLGITFVINKRDTQAKKSTTEKPPEEAPVASGNAFAMVIKDRYLLFILLLVFVLNIVTKSGDYVLDKMVLDHAHELAKQAGHVDAASVKEFTQKYIGEFKSPYFFWINALGVVLQLFAVSRVIKYFGVKVALILVPIASLGGYTASLIAPLIGVLFVGRVVESSLDYSLSNTARQALWLVTTREAKYKAKQVIDTFIVRFGDAASAAVVWIGTQVKLGHRGFLAINVGFSILWVLVTLMVNREYDKHGQHPPAKSNAEEASSDGEAQPA